MANPIMSKMYGAGASAGGMGFGGQQGSQGQQQPAGHGPNVDEVD